MLLKELANQPFVARARVAEAGFDLQGVTVDSRRAGRGVGFFAVAGLREDGHAYLERALAGGAPVLFFTDGAAFEAWEERTGETSGPPAPPTAPLGTFLVEGGRAGLARLASALWGAPSRRLELLAVTGTNGKTTVAHLVRHLSGAAGTPCAVIGTLGMALPGAEPGGALRTTPEAPEVEAFLAACVAEGVGRVAMEATSIGIALERTRALAFRAAAFTNLTREHLDFHGTFDAYREAKFRLFLAHETGAAVVNLDDPTGRELAGRLGRERPGLPVLTFSAAGQGELTLEGVERGGKGSRGWFRYGGERFAFETPLVGDFNLSNLLAAMGLLLAAGEAPGPLAGAVAACGPAPGRFERVARELPFTVVVDYAHTPDALEHALGAARRALGDRPGARVLVLVGCGGERDREKRPLMGGAAERLADVAVLTSDNPRGESPEAILAELATGLTGDGGEVHQMVERAEAIRWVLEKARPGDLVLLAGKGHEPYQEIGGRRLAFDDREQVRRWAAEQGA